jgi:hypothetical protein
MNKHSTTVKTKNEKHRKKRNKTARESRRKNRNVSKGGKKY